MTPVSPYQETRSVMLPGKIVRAETPMVAAFFDRTMYATLDAIHLAREAAGDNGEAKSEAASIGTRVEEALSALVSAAQEKSLLTYEAVKAAAERVAKALEEGCEKLAPKVVQAVQGHLGQIRSDVDFIVGQIKAFKRVA